jgi:UDP-N-acetylmuramoylalanine--D-glutamate ligase
LKTNYPNANVAVLGLGASGQAAARLVAALGAHATVLDSGDNESLRQKAATLAGERIECLLGAQAQDAAGGRAFDLAVLSPGIDPAVPLVRALRDRGVALTGEMELGYSQCRWPVIAITGTNGKTTTTELVNAMLNSCGVRTIACGNIGRPFCDVVLENPDLDVITLEVSSFQLETISEFRPRVSAWLNFSPDHLDRYPTMTEYFDAKFRIFENQTANDHAIINASASLPPIAPRTVTFSGTSANADLHWDGRRIFHGGDPVFSVADSHFRGVHNAENLMAALAIGHTEGLTFEAMSAPLMECRPAAHRCEHVRELDGVTYINDSKSTNVDSLEKALLSMPERVVLIAGGKEKGFAFASIKELVRERVRCAVLIGETRARLREDWDGTTQLIEASSFGEAVDLARKTASPGDTVLLSPGTSSFDMFRDYADRGNQFRELVHQLKTL